MKIYSKTQNDFTITCDNWRWSPRDIVIDADIPEESVTALCCKQLRVMVAPPIRALKAPAVGTVERPDGETVARIEGIVSRTGVVRDGKCAGLPLYEGGTLILDVSGLLTPAEGTNVFKAQKEKIATQQAEIDELKRMVAQLMAKQQQ